MAENINIAGRLHSTATGNVVAGADEILYEPTGGTPKKQSEVNQETSAALTDRYTKSETYSKTQLNNMITTPNQEYVTLVAESGDTLSDIFDGITGAADTTYRVGNWDGSANSGAGGYDITTYSEYAYDGTNFVHLSTKTQIGEVFDISAYHATGGTLATYTDLATALDSNNGGGVPQSLQKGGMSVKFVHSSDNKYVQYMLKTQAWSPFVEDWEMMTLEGEIVELDKNTRLRNAPVSLVGAYDSSLGAYCAGSLEIRESSSYKYYLYTIPAHSYYTILQTTNAPGSTFVMSAIIDSLSDFVVGGYLYKALTIGNEKKDIPVTYYAANDTLVVVLSNTSRDDKYITLSKASTSVAAESVATIKPVADISGKVLFVSNVIDNFSKTGRMINTSGNEVENAHGHATDYIPVVAGSKVELHNFRITGSTPARAFFYDKYKEPIAGSAVQASTSDTLVITVPDNACYARFSDTFENNFSVAYYPQSTIVLKSNIGEGIQDIHSEIGVFDIPFELGGVSNSNSSIDYLDTNTSIRTERGKLFFLNSGDIVKLSNYSTAKFMLKWKKKDGTFGGTISWRTADVEVVEDGYYVILLGYQDNSVVSDISSLVSLLQVVCQRNNGNILSKLASIGTLKLETALAGDSTNLVDALGFAQQSIDTSGNKSVSTTRLLSREIEDTEGRIFIDTSNTISNLHILEMAFDRETGTLRDSSGWVTTKQFDFLCVPDIIYYILFRKEGDATITPSDLEGVNILFKNGSILACNENVMANLANIRRPYHNYSSSTSYNDCLVLAHFSDVHADKENIRRISEFCSIYGKKIDDVIQTGDLIGANLSDGIPSNWSALGSNVLGVIGNHDAQNKVNNVWTTQPAIDSYNAVFKDFIASWGVTQPTDAATNGYCYYFKDYAGQKIRLIAVDCMHWDSTQKTWFEGVLASAITDELSVIVAVHYLPFALAHSETAFDSIDQTASSSIGDILANAEIADAVADFISNDGEFICYLTGHTHIDFCGVGSTAPYDNQICITIATASSGLSATVYGDTERVAGTKSQDCLNIVALDTTSKTIKIYRIGVNHDRYLRTKDFMAWNYSTKQLIKMY